MSITWPDEQPGDTLRSRREEINFASDRPITEVRAVYSEELVYTEAGGFEPQFSGSAKNVAGTAFAVKRTGGWQRAVTIYPEEEPEPVPTTGAEWGIIYDLNLTAQAAQASIAAGEFTVDGLSWWAKGALATGQTSALVPGSGLKLVTASANIAGFTGGADINTRMFAFDPNEAPDFNPDAPWLIQWRLTATRPLNAGIAAQCGVCQGVPRNSSVFQAADWAGMFTLSSVDTSATGQRYHFGPGVTNAVTVAPGISTDVEDWAQGCMYINDSARLAMIGEWTGAFPTVNAMNRAFVFGQQASTDPVFIYCHRKTTNGVGDLETYLTHLRILQPRIAA